MKLRRIIRRFLLPAPLITIYYLIKFKVFISHRAEVEINSKLTIGHGTIIGSFTKIKLFGGPLTIGQKVSIGAGCHIEGGEKGTIIGDKCLIGPHVIIIGNNCKYDQLDIAIRDQGHSCKGTHIENNVWIGVGACILDGSNIGAGSIVTPNSVVSGSVPPNSIVQGNPAKVIFTRR